MKKYIGIVAILLMLVGVARFVHAEDNGNTGGGLSVGGFYNQTNNQQRNESGVQKDIKADDNTQGDFNLRGGLRGTDRTATKEQITQEKELHIQQITDMLAQTKAERDAFKIQLQSDKTTFQKDLEDRKVAFKTLTADRKNELRNNIEVMISEKFTKNIARLTALQIKLSARATVATKAGFDVSAAQAALLDVTVQLANANNNMLKVQALLPTDWTKITADLYVQIKTLAFDGKKFLEAAKQDLRDALHNLRPFFESPVAVTTQ